MLNPSERKGLEFILNGMEYGDLLNLCDTVTKRMLRGTNRKEAVEAILSCIQKPSDLLKRQKITRKVLFQYLRDQNELALPEHSKVDLVTMCLDLWKSIDTSQAMDFIEIVPDVNCGRELAIMGVAFTKWFFPLFNELQDFGTEHFWNDCKLDVVAECFNTQMSLVGDRQVVDFLTNLITYKKYFFHPNYDSGTTCEQERHGLVKISVDGVLHQLNNCIGLFESAFGLVRNPDYENNWKIRWLYLNLRITTPTLSIH